MPTAYKTIYDELKRAHAGDLEKAKADNTSFYSAQANSTNKLYDEKVDKQSKAYEDSYRENAIQKLINERQVAENMANLGLTNSGLNRTQQTAVQLSYANNKAGIDKQKQSAISDLNLARTQALDTIEQKRLADEASIIQNHENMLNKSAQSIYEEEIKAENERIAKIQKEQEEMAKTKYKVRTAGGSGLDDNGNELFYFYDENGKKYSYPKGINPYTGRPITGGYTAKEIESYGGVWNGYQPKGVKHNGQNYGAVQKYEVDRTDPNTGKTIKSPVQIKHQGHYKTIWQTNDGKLWVWDDEVGNYMRAYDDGKGNISYEYD